MNWWKETNLFPASGVNGSQNGQYPGQRPGDIPEWEARFEYDAGEEVYTSGNYYRCAESHIASQVFATDLAAGKWVIFAGPDVVTAGEMAFAASDQTTPLVVAANIAGIFAEFDMTLQSLFAGVGVLGTTSGTTTIMIQKKCS